MTNYQLLEKELATGYADCAKIKLELKSLRDSGRSSSKEARNLTKDLESVQNKVKGLEQKRLAAIRDIAIATTSTFQQGTGSAASFISTLGHNVANWLQVTQNATGSGTSAIGSVASFVTLLQELNSYQETKQILIMKEAAKKELAKDPIKNKEAIKLLDQEIASLNKKLAATQSNIIVQSATTAKNVTQVGSSTIAAVTASGVHLAPHVATALQGASIGAAGFVGIVGVALAANALNDNRVKYDAINDKIQQLQKQRDNSSQPYLKSLIDLKIKNLETQRQDVLAEVGRNTATLVSSGIGIAAGALAAASLTVPPVTIAAAAAAGIGLAGYGGYLVYKNRHLIRLHTEQTMSRINNARLNTSIAYTERHRAAAQGEAKGVREGITSENVKTADFIQDEFEKRMQDKEAEHAEHQLLQLAAEFAGDTQEVERLQKPIRRLTNEMDALARGKIVLLKAQEGNQAVQINASMKKVDKADDKLGQLSKAKMQEQKEMQKRAEAIEDAKIAKHLGVHPKEIGSIRSQLNQALGDPKQASDLNSFLEEEFNFTGQASAQNFMDWLVKPL